MADSVHIGDLEINPRLRYVRVKQREVRISKKEWALLRALIHHGGQVVTHQRLMALIWGDTYGYESRYLLHALIKRLRRKLGDRPPRYILVDIDVGYRLAIPPAPQPGEQ